MKKLTFTLSILCISGVAFAQTTVGIKAGPAVSSYTVKYGGPKETSKMIVGLSGGVYANLPIAHQFYIQPSLMYEGKGGKSKDVDTKVRLNYLTLPVDLVFKPEMRDGKGSWMVGVGAYIGYGLSGKTSLSADDSVTVFAFEDNPFKKHVIGPVLKRFDAGADVQLGYEMANGLNVGVHMELGLINILYNKDDNNSLRNTSFNLMIGYTFGKY